MPNWAYFLKGMGCNVYSLKAVFLYIFLWITDLKSDML